MEGRGWEVRGGGVGTRRARRVRGTGLICMCPGENGCRRAWWEQLHTNRGSRRAREHGKWESRKDRCLQLHQESSRMHLSVI